jgi:hypothetical protein
MIRITPMILEFCPNHSQRLYPDRNLPITRRTPPEDKDESSKQRDDEHHASNQSTTILDEHKNLVGTPVYHLEFPLCIQFMIPGRPS